MKYIYIFLLSLLMISCSKKNFDLQSNQKGFSSKQNGWIEMCDSTTNEVIFFEPSNFEDIDPCCYEFIDGRWKKRLDDQGKSDCDNLEKCKQEEKVCRVGKSVYALWDNTGTSWNASYVFEVTFDNATTELVSQPAITSGTWTGQLNYWSSTDGFALNEKCVYEPSCNILPNGCGGLNAPPTEVLASGEDISGMYWRYLNVKCCFTEKIPVKIEVVESSIPTHIGRKLDLVVFYGEEIEYEICAECGEKGDLLYYDTKEPVLEQDMPICTRPCGFDFPNLASPSCSFTYIEGCDQNVDPVQNIVIQYVDCGEGKIQNAIFALDSNGGLSDYEPVLIDSNGDGEATANIDDCNGGEIVGPEPLVDCGQPTGDCRCYGGGENATDYAYVNSDNETEGSFSMNTTTIKWAVGGGDGSLDGSIPYIDDCITNGGEATITMTDVSDNVIVFVADGFLNAPDTTPTTAYSGTGTGGFSGKLKEVKITCSTSESGAGKACAFIDCEGNITWKDTKTGETLTEEDCETLEECVIPTTLEPLCEENLVEFIACATEAIAGVAIDDYILTIATQDCNQVITSSKQYNITQGNTELTDVFNTTACDPSPDIETLEECFIDSLGVQWTHVFVLDPLDNSVIADIYYDSTFELGTPSGEPKSYKPCPNASGLEDVEKACFEWFGNTYTGYAFAYSDGEIQLGLTLDTDETIVGANPFCCTDCIQVFGCRDGRLAMPIGSQVVMANGDVLDISGLRYTQIAQLIVDIYGGTFSAPSLGGPKGPNFSQCQGSSQHELQLNNVPVQVGYITDWTNYGTFGQCSFDNVDCDLVDYYKVEILAANEGLIRTEYLTGNRAVGGGSWGDSNLAASIMDAFDPQNSTPTNGPTLSTNGLLLNDTSNTASPEQDVEYKEGYITVSEPFKLYFNTNSEGAIRLEIGFCCGALVEQYTHAKGTGNFPTPIVEIPVGRHKIKLTNLDMGGSNSNWNAYVSFDNISYTLDNTPNGVNFVTVKPREQCLKGYICNGTWYESDKETPIVFDELTYKCKIECVDSSPCKVTIK